MVARRNNLEEKMKIISFIRWFCTIDDETPATLIPLVLPIRVLSFPFMVYLYLRENENTNCSGK
jgi:hypothetical protein